MDKIDVVFYINLAHRTDRRAHIEAQLRSALVPQEKIIRIDAIKAKPGAQGCTLSHIKTLTAFLNNLSWKTAMVLEDDFTFNSGDINARLAEFTTNFSNWDVLTLAYNPKGLSILDTHVNNVKKVLTTQTTSGYIITRQFASKLRENWRLCSELNAKEGLHPYTCCDNTWRILQPAASW